MLYKIKKSIDEGWSKLRWYASIISERMKVEVAVIRLLRESADMEKKREELVCDIGERVFELRASSDMNIYEDSKVVAALKELESLDEELGQLKSRASEIGQPEEQEEEQ